MTTVRAASSATLSVALAPRRVVAHREAPAQEVAHRVAAVHAVVPQEAVIPQGNRTVAAVVPAVTKTAITIHRAVVAEAVGDNGHV